MRNPVKEHPIEDLTAGNAFRETMVRRADTTLGGAPMWFGWALMEAFLAGAEYGRQSSSAKAE